jgi:membrane protein implicated in regulation of membrane protease activity
MENINEWLKPQLIWFVVGFILLLFEFVNPGLVIGFFGVGAWIVAFLCLFLPIPVNLQLVIFIVSSIVLLVVFRKKFKTLFQDRVDETESSEAAFEDFIGKRAVVTQDITPKNVGKVEFRGTHWEAKADETIPEGASVEIIGKDNITLKVKPL